MQGLNDYIRMVMDKKIVLYHVLGWTVFIAYELLVIFFIAGRFSPVADFVSHYLLNAILFYCNVAVITRTRDKVAAAGLIIAEIAVYLAANFYINTFLQYFGIQLTRPTHPLRSFFVASFWRCIYFIGLSAGYGLAVNLIRAKEQMGLMLGQQLQKEKDKVVLERDLLTTQNALLRAQINPHLFFNTLTFIYNSVRKVSATAGEAVLLLADITRYSIGKSDGDGKVLLSDELTHVNDLIALNQVRYNNSLHVQFDIEGKSPAFRSFRIVPLVFLTLVENVFKYGDLQDPDSPAVIYVQVVDDFLHFATRNRKLSEMQKLRGDGIGLSNARFRLQDAYPDQFQLRLNETADMFFVDLTINVDCLCPVVLS